MPLPVSYDTVNVRGKYTKQDGSPAKGYVKFTGKVVSTVGNVMIVPGVAKAELDETGSFSVNLPATDDPDASPNGWTYHVVEKIEGFGGRSFDIDVPISAVSGGIELATVAPVIPRGGDPTAFVTLTAFNEALSNVETGGPHTHDWVDITGEPATFPPSAHTHTIANVTGLQTALDSVVSSVFPLKESYGLLAATGDPIYFQGNGTWGNSQTFMARMWVPANVVITNLWLGTDGNGVHDGTSVGNYIAIYDDTGVRLGRTAENPSMWTTAGWHGGPIQTGPIAAQSTGRFVWMAALTKGLTTSANFPTVAGAGNRVILHLRPGGGSQPRRVIWTDGIGADLPASFNPMTFGFTTGFLPMYGIT